MSTTLIIPSDPKTRQTLKNAIKEIDASMTRIKAEQENISEICKNMKEKAEIPPATVRKLGTIYHNQNMAEQVSNIEDLEALYDTILK